MPTYVEFSLSGRGRRSGQEVCMEVEVEVEVEMEMQVEVEVEVEGHTGLVILIDEREGRDL